MHGTNIRRHKEDRADGLLQVHKIFYTIQGEGPRAGQPAVFIRLTGCNQRCWFCDTEWDDGRDEYFTAPQIREKVLKILPRTCKLIVITGGEPCRQQIDPLVDELLNRSLFVQIETAGTIWRDCMSWPNVEVIVSPKTPRVIPRVAVHAIAYKYIIREGNHSAEDGLPIESTQDKQDHHTLARPPIGTPVFLSPCDEGQEDINARNRQTVLKVALKFGYRVSLQMHKILGVE